jgi:hypothetical protein
MTRPATRANPFPRDAVAKDSIERIPDYPDSRASLKASAHINGFLEDFLEVGRRDGVALGIRGRFGAGKTHLLLRLKRDAEERAKRSKGRLSVHTVYLKLDSCDILQLYRKFSANLSAESLRDGVARHVASLMRRSGAGSTGNTPGDLQSIALAEVERYVTQDPAHVLHLVEAELLPNTSLREEYVSELSEPSRIRVDFSRAYAYALDPKFGDAAIRWLMGDSITEVERKDLGLTHAVIQDAEQAKEALAFLLRAHAKSDIAVLLMIDEFERFAWRGTPAERKASVSLLKDLAEVFKDSGHCLVIAGVNEAFESMTADVFDRVKHEDIIEVRLDQEEARKLLEAWSRPSASNSNALFELFEPAALDELCETAQNVSRRLLNLAHLAFAASRAQRITKAHVRQAVERLSADEGRLESLQRMVRETAAAHGFEVESGVAVGPHVFDFVVGGLDDPESVVVVTRAAYKIGEVDTAKNVADKSAFVRKRFPTTRFCVIIAGYSSESVINELTRVTNRVIQFEEDRFPAEWDACLSGPRPKVSASRSATRPSRELETVHSALESIRSARIAEVDSVDHHVASATADVRAEAAQAAAVRIGDKISDLLEQLRETIQTEERLALRVWRKEAEMIALKSAKLSRVLELLDGQRKEIRRAEFLNDGLPQQRVFEAKLDELMRLTNEAEGAWTKAAEREGELFLDDAISLGAARELFRDRYTQLDELLVIHRRRSPTGIWRSIPGAAHIVGRVPLLMSGALMVGLLGLVGHSGYVASRAVAASSAISTEADLAAALSRSSVSQASSFQVFAGVSRRADSLAGADFSRRVYAIRTAFPITDSAVGRVRSAADSLAGLMLDTSATGQTNRVSLARTASSEAGRAHRDLNAASTTRLVWDLFRAEFFLDMVLLAPWAILAWFRVSDWLQPRLESVASAKADPVVAA